MSDFSFYTGIYASIGLVVYLFILWLFWAEIKVKSAGSIVVQTIAIIALWPIFAAVILYTFIENLFITRPWVKNDRKHYTMLLLVFFMSTTSAAARTSHWHRIAVQQSTQYPGLYRVTYRHTTGITRSIITDDPKLKGGVL